ncbi:MAG: cysteine desulfurase NifS [Candidatus Hadarchaeum yellowstonense]|uniref:Cysteine desulfurase NifS n=1 Tax=Hadarchaeum yellowstonense TaxID=1776334 RepID=A0A147K102_HADYE|nr:MAG: cysteine desulfurase NifS [Candidatus Hadarchaeum yellowstonense]
MRVYLDNGTTTPVAPEVVEAMLPYFTEKFGHPVFPYSLGQEAADAVERAQEIIARSINARPEEVVFTSGATQANDMAIRGVAYANRNRGRHLITTKVENPSVLRVCERLEKEGFRVDYLPVDAEGFVDTAELEKRLSDETILVSVANVNDEIGTIEPVEEIGEILRERQRKIYFHVNAAAGYGRVEVDVKKIGADLVSLSAHKIHGPKGVGALYVAEGTPIEPVYFGYISLFNLRPGTENIPGIVGFGRAVELMMENFERDVAHMTRLRDRLISGFEEIPHTLINGPRGKKRSPANVSCSFKGLEGESMMLHLDLNGISVATGSACSTTKLEPSHVLTAIGLKAAVAHGTIRFTLSRYNTEEEIDYTLSVVPRVVEQLRRISPVKPEQL